MGRALLTLWGNEQQYLIQKVLEFSAPDGMVVIPPWLMEVLMIADGDEVRLKVKKLPKGKSVKIQPHSYEFGQLPDAKAMFVEI